MRQPTLLVLALLLLAAPPTPAHAVGDPDPVMAWGRIAPGGPGEAVVELNLPASTSGLHRLEASVTPLEEGVLLEALVQAEAPPPPGVMEARVSGGVARLEASGEAVEVDLRSLRPEDLADALLVPVEAALAGLEWLSEAEGSLTVGPGEGNTTLVKASVRAPRPPPEGVAGEMLVQLMLLAGAHPNFAAAQLFDDMASRGIRGSITLGGGALSLRMWASLGEASLLLTKAVTVFQEGRLGAPPGPVDLILAPGVEACPSPSALTLPQEVGGGMRLVRVYSPPPPGVPLLERQCPGQGEGPPEAPLVEAGAGEEPPRLPPLSAVGPWIAAGLALGAAAGLAAGLFLGRRRGR